MLSCSFSSLGLRHARAKGAQADHTVKTNGFLHCFNFRLRAGERRGKQKTSATENASNVILFWSPAALPETKPQKCFPAGSPGGSGALLAPLPEAKIDQLSAPRSPQEAPHGFFGPPGRPWAAAKSDLRRSRRPPWAHMALILDPPPPLPLEHFPFIFCDFRPAFLTRSRFLGLFCFAYVFVFALCFGGFDAFILQA